MSLIKIISTGGTIANTGRGLIGIDDVLKDIPQARGLADFEVAEATRVRSGSLRLSHWYDLARMVNTAAEDPRVDGIIVTHGTFTTEETAYFFAPDRSHRKTGGNRRFAAQARRSRQRWRPQHARCHSREPNNGGARQRCAG